MEAKKSPSLVNKMFASGEVTFIDPKTRYRYSLVALCPKDGNYSYVERFDKSTKGLISVTFACPVCLTQFKVPKSQIMVV